MSNSFFLFHRKCSNFPLCFSLCLSSNAVSLQPTDEKTRTKQKSRLYLSSDKIVTPAPKHKEYAIPNTTTVHPRATGKEGRVGPLKVSPPKKDVMMISEFAPCLYTQTHTEKHFSPIIPLTHSNGIVQMVKVNMVAAGYVHRTH